VSSVPLLNGFLWSWTMSIESIVNARRDLLDEGESANLLGLAPGTLGVWRSTGRYQLPFVKIGRNVRYRRADLDAWLESRTRTTGATA
jgi:excisionase family DNA binding protein